jgi:hypothetical protein
MSSSRAGLGGLCREKTMAYNTYTELQIRAVHQLFGAHGMDVLGPPLIVD